jgi:hypothetical protein
MSEVLRDKANINKLSQWLMKDVIKEEENEMKKLALSKGPGKVACRLSSLGGLRNFSKLDKRWGGSSKSSR